MTKVSIKGSLEVEITEIDVEGYEYEIHYRYRFDNKIWENDMYGSDFEGWTVKQWEKELKEGEALKIIMQQITENL